MRAAGLVGVLLTVAPQLAAGQAAERTLQILALDAERPESILVRMDDQDRGTSLQVLRVPDGEVKKGWFVETRRDERARVKRLQRKRFPVPAVVDQVEPDKGRYTILGAPGPRKRTYRILAMKDGKVGVLAEIELREDKETKERARGMLREVVWAPSGNLVLCIVNQKLKRSEGIWDVDELHTVRFRPWKVKWLDAGDGDAEAATP